MMKIDDQSREQHELDDDDGDLTALRNSGKEWEITTPTLNDPIDNLASILRGFCIPGKKAKGRVRRKSDDNDLSTVCSDQSTMSNEVVPLSSIVATRKLDVIDLVHLLAFCDPLEKRTTSVDNECNNERSVLVAASEDTFDTQSIGDDDCQSHDSFQSNQLFDGDDECDECELVIETRPGTSRLVRVYKALLIFASAVFILGFTLNVLWHLDVKPHFKLITKDESITNSPSFYIDEDQTRKGCLFSNHQEMISMI